MSEYLRIIIREMIEKNLQQKGFDLLEEKLLNLGGTNVKCVYEENLQDLLKKGVEFNSTKVLVVKMNNSKCHENSACFWNNYTNEHGASSLNIVTGWALDGDSWYQHTWLFQPKTNRIIETTHKRKKYFGFILTNEESMEFVYDNY